MFSPLSVPSFQISKRKQDLERASQLTQKMKKEADCLANWLDMTEDNLVHKITSEGLLSDLDTEISWAKVSCSSGGPPISRQRDLWHFCSGQTGWMSFSSILYLMWPFLFSRYFFYFSVLRKTVGIF